MSEDNEGKKSKGFDISSLGKSNETDDDRESTAERLREHHEELGRGRLLIDDAMLQTAAREATRFQEAFKASSVGSIQDQVNALTGARAYVDTLKAEHTAVSEAMKALNGAGMQEHLDAMTSAATYAADIFKAEQDAASAAMKALNGSNLHERMRALTSGIDEASALSRVAADISKQQIAIDSMDFNVRDVQPLHILDIKNPIVETNERLARIECQFDQISHIAKDSAQIATGLQLAAAEFLKKFEAAARQNDESASKAIKLGKQAVWIAVLIPLVVFGAQIAVNFLLPDTQTEALKQSVTGLQTEIEAMRTDQTEASQRLIDALATSDQATAAAIRETIEALSARADEGALKKRGD